MKSMRLFFLLFLVCSGCNAQHVQSDQDQPVGGPFENSELFYIGMPENINAIDTSPGWTQKGQKLLVTGTVYRKDGKTPAPGVIVYYYHTDVSGHYAIEDGLDPRADRHGYIRGWVKSDPNGHYAIYTVRPAPYPNASEPAHIHPAIKEQGYQEYWLDGLVFDDDKLAGTRHRQAQQNRGGSGVLRVLLDGDMQIAEHDIILGLNIPGYAEEDEPPLFSGPSIGEDISSFTPTHVWGPDKGSTTCPICKYGRYHGILYFVGNNPKWSEIRNWLEFFEHEAKERRDFLKVYFVFGNEAESENREKLAKLGQDLNLTETALTFVPSWEDHKSEIYLNQINPDVNSTILLYRHSTVIDKFINYSPTPANIQLLRQRLDETQGHYFHLSPPKIEE